VPAISLWAATYLSTIIVTAAIATGSHAGQDIGYNAIPWVGPWVCMAACQRPAPYVWALATSGVVQAITTVLWIIGLAVHVGGDDPSALLEHDGWRISPWASLEGGGLLASTALPL